MSISARIIQHARNGDLVSIAVSRMRAPRNLGDPLPPGTRHSARRVNSLFNRLPGAERYLEVGLEEGYTFQGVTAPLRWGVDPAPKFKLDRLPPGTQVSVSTSDEFFAKLDPTQRFDVIFLDGLHTFRQTYRDLINACRLAPNGVILIDDVIPSDEVSAMPDRVKSQQLRSRLRLEDPYRWHGDVFRVVLCIVEYHPELSIRTIVGPDNPQALVWLNSPEVPVMAIDEASLSAMEEASYSEIFEHNIPESFFPRQESEAIDDWIAARD